jgi:hypothetical protein
MPLDASESGEAGKEEQSQHHLHQHLASQVAVLTNEVLA